MRLAGGAYNGAKNGDSVVILDIGWRSVIVAAVFLIDLVVFADLARAEFSNLQKKHARRARAERKRL